MTVLCVESITVEMIRDGLRSYTLIESSEGPWSWRCWLRWDYTTGVLYPQAAVESLEYLYPQAGIAGLLLMWCELQGVPAVFQRVVPRDLPRVFVAEDPVEVDVSRWMSGSSER